MTDVGQKIVDANNDIFCYLTFNLPERCKNQASPMQPTPVERDQQVYDQPIGPQLPPETPKPKANNRPPVYQPPVLPPPEIPDRKLPKEADNQTDFDTPNGRSISLQQSLKERHFGRLLWNPVSNEKVEVKMSDYGDLVAKFTELQTHGAEQFTKWLNGEKVEFWDKTALVFAGKTEGMQGDIGVNFGLGLLGEITSVYKGESQNALMRVHDFIPSKFETKKDTPEISRNFLPNDLNLASIGKIEQVLAPNEFPGELPHLLNIERNGETSEDRKVKNYPELFIRFFTEFDSILGEFPIKIKIDDADITEGGNQEKQILIGNLAEGISEIFGLGFSGGSINDAVLNILLRLIPEIIRIRQLSLTTQDVCIANRDFLGYPEKEVVETVESNFSAIKKLTDIAKILEPESQKYKTIEFDGKDTLMAYLMRLQFVASLQKAALTKSVESVENLIDKAQNGDINNSGWDEFVNEINNPLSQFNLGEKVSRIRDVE